MVNVICPYCDHSYSYTPDEPVGQDERSELQCPNCDMNFTALANYSFSWMFEEKAPCLNGESHEYKDVCRFPMVVYGKVQIRCRWCGDKTNVPYSEGIKYGYDPKELESSLKHDPQNRVGQ